MTNQPVYTKEEIARFLEKSYQKACAEKTISSTEKTFRDRMVFYRFPPFSGWFPDNFSDLMKIKSFQINSTRISFSSDIERYFYNHIFFHFEREFNGKLDIENRLVCIDGIGGSRNITLKFF